MRTLHALVEVNIHWIGDTVVYMNLISKRCSCLACNVHVKRRDDNAYEEWEQRRARILRRLESVADGEFSGCSGCVITAPHTNVAKVGMCINWSCPASIRSAKESPVK